MSDIISATETTREAPAAKRRDKKNIALWVVQVVLAAQFASGGILKLTGSQSMVDMFVTIGAGDWFRFLVGVLEIAGAIGLLIPRLTGLAAACLAALMVGAAITQAAILGGAPVIEIVFLVLATVVAYHRRDSVKSLFGKS